MSPKIRYFWRPPERLKFQKTGQKTPCFFLTSQKTWCCKLSKKLHVEGFWAPHKHFSVGQCHAWHFFRQPELHRVADVYPTKKWRGRLENADVDMKIWWRGQDNLMTWTWEFDDVDNDKCWHGMSTSACTHYFCVNHAVFYDIGKNVCMFLVTSLQTGVC